MQDVLKPAIISTSHASIAGSEIKRQRRSPVGYDMKN
jgi:hypothetical protein